MMADFQITLEYDKQDLIDAMARAHGVTNVAIERPEDVNGVVSFLLKATGSNLLEVDPNYSDFRIGGGKVAFSLVAHGLDGDWQPAVQKELQAFEGHIAQARRR